MMELLSDEERRHFNYITNAAVINKQIFSFMQSHREQIDSFIQSNRERFLSELEELAQRKEVLDMLLKAGADPLIPIPPVYQFIPTQEKDITVLEKAVIHGANIDRIRRFLEIPAVKKSLMDNTREARRAFVQAVRISVRSPEIMDMFLKAGADPLGSDEEGNTVLMSIANPNPLSRKTWKVISIEDEDGDGRVDLKCVINMRNPYSNDSLKRFLEIPAVRNNIDARNLKGETALFLTAKFLGCRGCNNMDNLEQLLKAGADPLIPDKKGVTVLEAMAKNLKCNSQYRHLHIDDLHRLLHTTLLGIPDVRQNISEREALWLPFWNTLMTFRKFNDMDSVQNLLEQLAQHSHAEERINSKTTGYLSRLQGIGRKIPKRHSAGYYGTDSLTITSTVFLKFIQMGPLEIVDLLLKFGADPLITDGNDNTALMLAANSNRPAILKRLLEIPVVKAKDHIDAINKQGDSAFRIAAENGNHEIMNLLQAARANSEVPHKEGKKTEKKKSLHAKKDDAGKNNTGKNREQSPSLRETAEAEKKKTSLPEDSFWERALSSLKKLLY